MEEGGEGWKGGALRPCELRWRSGSISVGSRRVGPAVKVEDRLMDHTRTRSSRSFLSRARRIQRIRQRSQKPAGIIEMVRRRAARPGRRRADRHEVSSWMAPRYIACTESEPGCWIPAHRAPLLKGCAIGCYGFSTVAYIHPRRIPCSTSSAGAGRVRAQVPRQEHPRLSFDCDVYITAAPAL